MGSYALLPFRVARRMLLIGLNNKKVAH